MSAQDTITRQHRFTITPEHLIFDPRVSDRAVRLWMRLDRYAGDRESAMPYREMLCVDLDCSLATVDRAIGELVDAGWLRKEWIPSANRNKYTLIVAPQDQVMTLVEAAREERRGRWGSQRARLQDQSSPVRSPHPRRHQSSPMTTRVLTHDAQEEATRGDNKKETNTPSADADAALFDVPSTPAPPKPVRKPRATGVNSGPEFDQFWEAYPKKVDKPVARKAWPKALKAAGGRAEVIISGARAYRGDPNRKPQYTKNPATWLNAEAWANEVGQLRPAPVEDRNGFIRPDGSIDVAAVLGKDVWSLPDPPDELFRDRDDTGPYLRWAQERRDERNAERLEKAKEVLRRKGYEVA